MVQCLVCTTCGIDRTYADAYVADIERSCDGEEHDWVKPMHKKIDVI